MAKKKDEKPRNVSDEILKMDKIPDRFYQIKFRIKDQFPDLKTKEGRGTTEWAFGKINTYHDDAQMHWDKNQSLVIDDALRDKEYLINPRFFDIVYIPFNLYGAYEDKDEYEQFIDDEYKKAQKISDDSPTLVNKLFKVGVGDGYACYIVTRETANKATIERRKFCCDDWADQYLGYGGDFNRERIADMVAREEHVNSMFPCVDPK